MTRGGDALQTGQVRLSPRSLVPLVSVLAANVRTPFATLVLPVQ